MKFRPVPLDDEYGHRRLDGGPWESATAAAVAQLVGGYQTFWGIPFHFGPEEPELRSLLVVDSSRAPAPVELSLDGLASHVVIAHFCDSRSASGVGGQSSDYANPAVTAPGEHLADYVLLYQDGTTAAIPVRRRFEVNQISTFLQNAFVARQQHEPRALDLHGPYDADLWGRTQMGVVVGGLARWSIAPHWLGDDLSPRASWSIYAMPNPH